MNPNEPTSKDVLEADFKALCGPVQDLFLKLTGPAAEEYGLMWQDSVRIRRNMRVNSGTVQIGGPGFMPEQCIVTEAPLRIVLVVACSAPNK